MIALAIVIAAIAAGWAELRTRRRAHRSRRLVRQLRADLEAASSDRDRLRAERDQLQRQLANVNGSLAHALRAQHLEHEDAEAEAYRAFESFEAALAAIRASRDQALRDRDAHATRCTELAQAITEMEVDRDRLSTELDQAYVDGAAIAAGRPRERGRPCAELDAYFDDELHADQADEFRAHLATCERCQRVLEGRMQEQVAVAMEAG